MHDVIPHGDIVVRKVNTQDNPTNMMIKSHTPPPPAIPKFEHCLDLVDICYWIFLGAFVKEVESFFRR